VSHAGSTCSIYFYIFLLCHTLQQQQQQQQSFTFLRLRKSDKENKDIPTCSIFKNVMHTKCTIQVIHSCFSFTYISKCRMFFNCFVLCCSSPLVWLVCWVALFLLGCSLIVCLLFLGLQWENVVSIVEQKSFACTWYTQPLFLVY
jgi:hypothetical protein